MIWILVIAVLALAAAVAAVVSRRPSPPPAPRFDPIEVEREVQARLYGDRRNGHTELIGSESGPPAPEPRSERNRERLRDVGWRRRARA